MQERSEKNWFNKLDFPSTISREQIEADWRRKQEATDKAIAERQERDKKRAVEREKAAQERAASELDAFKTQKRISWIASTGSESGFEQAWPRMLEAFVEERGTQVERIRREMAASGDYARLI